MKSWISEFHRVFALTELIIIFIYRFFETAALLGAAFHSNHDPLIYPTQFLSAVGGVFLYRKVSLGVAMTVNGRSMLSVGKLSTTWTLLTVVATGTALWPNSAR